MISFDLEIVKLFDNQQQLVSECIRNACIYPFGGGGGSFFNLKPRQDLNFKISIWLANLSLPLSSRAHILTSAFCWIPADCADSQKSFTSCVVPFPISLSLSRPLLFIYFSLYLVPGDPFIFSFPRLSPFTLSSEISYLHDFREIIRNSIILLPRPIFLAILLKESLLFRR